MSSSIYIDIGHADGYSTEVEVGNYTHNISPMMRAACGVGLQWFDKVSCEKALPILAHAWREMKRHPRKFEKLNPPNGWGSYDSFMPFLTRFYVLVRLHPNGQIRNWY